MCFGVFNDLLEECDGVWLGHGEEAPHVVPVKSFAVHGVVFVCVSRQGWNRTTITTASPLLHVPDHISVPADIVLLLLVGVPLLRLWGQLPRTFTASIYGDGAEPLRWSCRVSYVSRPFTAFCVVSRSIC